MDDWFEDACTWPEQTRYEYTQWALGNVNETPSADEDEEWEATMDCLFSLHEE